MADTVYGDQNSTQSLNLEQAEEKTLAETAAEIQDLIEQLEKTNPNATETEKIEYASKKVSKDLKSRAIQTLQAGGEAAIERFLGDNPYVGIVTATIKAWRESA